VGMESHWELAGRFWASYWQERRKGGLDAVWPGGLGPVAFLSELLNP
jgi:hypothetical protein